MFSLLFVFLSWGSVSEETTSYLILSSVFSPAERAYSHIHLHVFVATRPVQHPQQGRA